MNSCKTASPYLSSDSLKERPDLALIDQWIKPHSKVLDLGCGNGLLLAHLHTTKHTQGLGIEINPDKITQCLARGVNVIEQNLNQGLNNFETGQFDTVIMSQTIQAVKCPTQVLDDMLRVGKTGIVSFPNFGHWQIRLQLALKGQMPKSDNLPFEWHDTPNIHLCTVNDFKALCQQKGFRILNHWVVDNKYTPQKWPQLWPNVLGKIALYHITREPK